MRIRTLAIALTTLSLLSAGCAGGFRVGGNNFGAGIGAYIGPVPDAVRPDHSCYPPPEPPGGELPPPMPHE